MCPLAVLVKAYGGHTTLGSAPNEGEGETHQGEESRLNMHGLRRWLLLLGLALLVCCLVILLVGQFKLF
jgi:hypothetical protein